MSAAERQVRYRAAHPERIKAYTAKAYDPAKMRAWRAANPERELARRRAERTAHPERPAVYARTWRQRHPEMVREQVARQRARRASALCTHASCLALGPLQLAWQLSDHRCYLCGVPVVSGGNLHMDHVTPLARGGLHCAENLRSACAPCNQRKSDKLLEGVA